MTLLLAALQAHIDLATTILDVQLLEVSALVFVNDPAVENLLIIDHELLNALEEPCLQNELDTYLLFVFGAIGLFLDFLVDELVRQRVYLLNMQVLVRL